MQFKNAHIWILLAMAIAVSVYSHSLVWKEFIAPTFGNTGIHVASARHFFEKGAYPLEDYSYGGGIPNIYVPIYRSSLAQIAWLTGWDFDFINRMIVMLFSVLLPLGFFSLGRKLFGTNAGILSAFLASLPAELLIYTVRPLPQAMGLAILPLTILLVYRGERRTAILASLVTVLVHQEAALFFVAAAFAYGVAGAALNYLQKQVVEEKYKLAIACWLVGVLTYLAWHFATTGTIAFWELAQFKYHEGNVLEFNALLQKTGFVVTILAALGFVASAYYFLENKSKAVLFALCLFATGLLLVKNDLIGLRVFMDRFLVYLQIPMVLLAGFSASKIIDFARNPDLFVKRIRGA